MTTCAVPKCKKSGLYFMGWPSQDRIRRGLVCAFHDRSHGIDNLRELLHLTTEDARILNALLTGVWHGGRPSAIKPELAALVAGPEDMAASLSREEAKTFRDSLAQLVGARVANALFRNGYGSAAQIRAATDDELLGLIGFGPSSVALLRKHYHG